jgi:Zn-dependent peptidase ImmA (M78 family)
MDLFMKPKQVKILGRKFKIKYVTVEAIAKKHGLAAVGLMDWEKKEIFISKALNEHDTLLTLVHEFVHVSHYVTGLNQVIAPEIQELLCETTAALFEDIRDLLQSKS